MQTATPETAQLPEKLYTIVIYYPEHQSPGPVFLPVPPEGPTAVWMMPVFELRELAEAFLASPNFERPGIVKEITLEQFIKAGEDPVAIGKECEDVEFAYMVDPKPMHEWQSVEDWGYLIPMDAAARMLREELE